MNNNSTFRPKKVIDYITKTGKSLEYKKGEYIFLPGDKKEHIYLITQGEVFISRIQDDGKELIIKLLNEYNIFGATTIHTKDKEYTTYAKVKTNCKCIQIDKRTFKTVLMHDEYMLKEWMEWLEIEKFRYSLKMRDLFMYGKAGALASTLIRLSNSFGVKNEVGIFINTQLTNQDIAAMCGTTRENVNRSLVELKNKEIISIKKKYITIHNLQYLKDSIRCDGCDFEICQVH